MIKKIIFILSISIVATTVFAETIAMKLKGNLKYKGSESIEVNATALVDKKEIKKSKDSLNELVNYSNEQSQIIINNNTNRKPRTKYKGGAEEIYEDYANSVVYIENRKDNGSGSGFIINHKGLKIITNWHVIENATNIKVCLKTEKLKDYCRTKYFSGKVVKTNKEKDLAMIEVKGLPADLKAVSYGSFKNVRVGETVFAIGHPYGHVWTFTDGRVSQKRPNHRWHYKESGHFANTIQTNVDLLPGNSGGPLFNKNKKLIGVNTFTTSESESLNFAIAVDDLIEFINEVKQKDIDSPYIKKKKKGNTWIQKKTDKNKKSGLSIEYPDATEADVNNNGIVDTWFLDENKDGNFEMALIDFNEDGIIEAVAFDENENQNFEMIIYDNDLDGNPDEAEYDQNDDGTMDILAFDYNQDGEWDKFEIIS